MSSSETSQAHFTKCEGLNNEGYTDDSIEQSSQINENVVICHPQPPIIIEAPTEATEQTDTPQKLTVNFKQHVDHPIGFDPSRRRKSEYRQDELVHTVRKSYLLKNFQEEIYAFKHIKEFLHDAVVVLEGHKHISVDVVIEDCIRKIFPKMDPETVHHIRNEMFTTPNEVLNPVYIDTDLKHLCDDDLFDKIPAHISMLSEVMQGCEVTEDNTHYRQDWICMMHQTKYTRKAKICISRTAENLNLGSTCSAVRFIILILTPVKAPMLSDSIELGRTFATLFNRQKFVQKLLEIDDEKSFLEMIEKEADRRRYVEDLDSNNLKTMRPSMKKRLSLHSFVDENEFSGHVGQTTCNYEDDNSGRYARRNSVAPPFGNVATAPFDSYSRRVRHDTAQSVGNRFHHRDSVFNNSVSDIKYRDPKTDAGSTSGSSRRRSLSQGSDQAPRHKYYASFHASDEKPWYIIGNGIFTDLKRRAPHYLSDWTDAFYDSSRQRILRAKDMKKIVRALFLALVTTILPVAAFGVANEVNTGSEIGMERTIFGQALAGLIFSVFSTQPLGLLMTTPPITLLISLIFKIYKQKFYGSDGVSFLQFYAMTGVFIGCFLIMYSLYNASRILKRITPSIEEIFAIFTAWAFCNEAVSQMIEIFALWYKDPTFTKIISGQNLTHNSVVMPSFCDSNNLTYFDANFDKNSQSYCQVGMESTREKAMLWLGLELSGFIFAFVLYEVFHKTPYLSGRWRNFNSDYALLISVIFFSLIYNLVFKKDIVFDPYVLAWKQQEFKFIPITGMPASAIMTAFGVAIPISFLFFFDQGFCSIVTNGKNHKLQKPGGYHADLFLVGLINILMSLLGCPWLHLALPHSDFHVRALADMDSEIVDGKLRETIRPNSVIEQRVTSFVPQVMIGITILPTIFKNTIGMIPYPVLSSVFWYMGITSLMHNHVIERFGLIFTETSSYTKCNYLKRVPIRNIHYFSMSSLLQVSILIIVGFYLPKYAKLGFPFLIALQIPLRHYILPKIINQGQHSSHGQVHHGKSFIDVLDGHH